MLITMCIHTWADFLPVFPIGQLSFEGLDLNRKKKSNGFMVLLLMIIKYMQVG